MNNNISGISKEQLAKDVAQAIDFYWKYSDAKYVLSGGTIGVVMGLVILFVLSIFNPFWFFVFLAVIVVGTYMLSEMYKDVQALKNCVQFLRQVNLLTDQEVYDILHKEMVIPKNVLQERYKQMFGE